MFEQIYFFLVILHILSCSYTVENYNTGQLQFNPSPIDFQATTTIENEKYLEEEANLRTFWPKRTPTQKETCQPQTCQASCRRKC